MSFFLSCVVVNLRVKTMATGRLGLEEHVCEVLLILRAFAELMVSRNQPCLLDVRPCLKLSSHRSVQLDLTRLVVSSRMKSIDGTYYFETAGIGPHFSPLLKHGLFGS